MVQIEQRIGVTQNKLAIFISDSGPWAFNLHISRPNTGLGPQGNNEKQPAIACKESQYTLRFSDAIDDQMNALGEQVAVFSALARQIIVLINVRATGIDEYSGTYRENFPALIIPRSSRPDSIDAPGA